MIYKDTHGISSPSFAQVGSRDVALTTSTTLGAFIVGSTTVTRSSTLEVTICLGGMITVDFAVSTDSLVVAMNL